MWALCVYTLLVLCRWSYTALICAYTPLLFVHELLTVVPSKPYFYPEWFTCLFFWTKVLSQWCLFWYYVLHVHVCMCVCTNFMTIYPMQGRCCWNSLSCGTAAGLLVNSCEWDCYWLENGVLVLNLATEFLYVQTCVWDMYVCIILCQNSLTNAGEMKM